MHKIFTFLFIVAALISCKSTKVSDKNISNMSARSIVKKNEAAAFSEHSIKASLQIKYRGKEELPNINASLRMVKDSVIWMNFSKLGFPIAKLMITPNEVKFYEKLSKSAFEGDFELISSWLGTSFDFEMVQNLLIGETLISLESQKLIAEVKDNQYELHPKKRNPIFALEYSIDPDHFKVMKERISHVEKNQNLTVLYKDFDKINESLFPKGFLISAKEGENETIIDVNYRNVQFDVPLRFPFEIPAGYSNIELE